MAYGLLTKRDIELLEKGLGIVCNRFPLIKVTEVGVRGGDTSRAMRDFVLKRNKEFFYEGFDNNKDLGVTVKPFTEAFIVTGDSADTLRHSAVRPNFVFIDGCHCLNHTMLDFLNISDRVVQGGIVAFHDVSPYANGIHYQHGDRMEEDSYISVRKALYILGLMGEHTAKMQFNWHMIEEGWEIQGTKEENNSWGGVALFEKINDIPLPDFTKLKGAWAVWQSK
jgi:hypothetical protein